MYDAISHKYWRVVSVISVCFRESRPSLCLDNDLLRTRRSCDEMAGWVERWLHSLVAKVLFTKVLFTLMSSVLVAG